MVLLLRKIRRRQASTTTLLILIISCLLSASLLEVGAMATPVTTIKIGARPSSLAQAQARRVEEVLFLATGCQTKVVAVLTQGDHVGPKADIQSVPLAVISSDFTSTLDNALLAREIDAAVHSLKDIPPTTRWRTKCDCMLEIVCYLPRQDPRDVLVVGSPAFASIDELPQHAKVGTSSARRHAQLLAKRPDLELVNLRGNVETRLEALSDGRVDALILAQAGLNRLLQNERDNDKDNHINSNSKKKTKLLLEQHAWHTIPSADMLPAPCQGIVAVVCRMYDTETTDLIETINDRKMPRWPLSQNGRF